MGSLRIARKIFLFNELTWYIISNWPVFRLDLATIQSQKFCSLENNFDNNWSDILNN